MRILLTTAMLSLAVGTLAAQDALWLYHATPVQKRVGLNPALPSRERAWLSLPVLGHVDQTVALPWSLDAVFRLEGQPALPTLLAGGSDDLESVEVDIPALIAGLTPLGRGRITTRVNLLSGGFQLPSGAALFLLIDQRLDVYASAGPEVVESLYRGEAFVRRLGRVPLEKLNYDALSWTSYAAGYQWSPGGQRSPWRLGGSLKVIRAQGHAGLGDITARIDDAPEDLSVLIEGQTRAAGLADLRAGTPDASRSVVGRVLGGKSWGLGADLGLVYDGGGSFRWSASLADIGYVRMSEAPATYEFFNRVREGASGPLSERNSTTVDVISSEVEALGKDGKSTLASEEPYTRLLPTALHLGGEFRFDERLSLGSVTRLSMRGERLQGATSLQLRAAPWRWLEAGVSGGWTAGAGPAAGLNAAVLAGPVHLYVGSDNVLGLFRYASSRWLNVAAGLTLVLPEGGGGRTKAQRRLDATRRRRGAVKCPEW